MPSAKVCPAGDLQETSDSCNSNHGDLAKTCWLISTEEEEDEQKENGGDEENGRSIEDEGPSPYQKVIQRLNSDEEWHKEISLEKRIGFYKLREELGTGNFSQVRLGIHCLTKERVAVKILDTTKLDKKTQRMLTREIGSMESLHHPHIIRLFEVIETLSKIYLVMEYAKGGEIFHRISSHGRFYESEAKPLFAQIIDAVDHMHAHNIIHRDLKAENVFFATPNIIKVGDFGFSTQIRCPEEALRTFCGSPPYAAPELFKDDSYLGPTVDIWALGVLLYFMLTASMPFKSQTVSGLKKMIVEGHFSTPQYLSSDCQWLIHGMLRKKPSARLSIEHIKTSRWLSGQTFNPSLPKYNVKPPRGTNNNNNDAILLTEEEKAVRSQLKTLGVTEAMIELSWDRGVRSSITGTYRILLHKLINPIYEEETTSVAGQHLDCSSYTLRSVEECGYHSPVKRKNKASKFCLIF